MSRELIAQLKKLKSAEVSPRAEWLEKNRATLMSQIKNTVTPEAKNNNAENIWNALAVFMPKQMVFSVVRPVAILLIVTLVATSGWVTTVDAAYNALPGDWLYPAKRAVEKGQLTVAVMMDGKAGETKTRTEFAKRRAAEAKQIVKSSDPNKTEKVKQVVNDLKQEMTVVNKNLEEMKTTASSAQTAKDVKKETDQIKDVLTVVKTDLLASNTSTIKEVAEAKDLVKDTSIKAVEVLVTKHLEGDKNVSTEEIKKELTSALENVTSDADAAKLNVEAVKEVANAVKTEVKEAIASAVVNGATSTQALNAKVVDITSTTLNAAVITDQLKATTDKQVDAAQSSLTKGDLVGALNMIKEVNSTTKEVEKVSDQTLSAVQTVLPVVSVVKEVAPTLPVLEKTEETKVEAPKIVVTVTTTPSTTEPVVKVDVAPATILPRATTTAVTAPLSETVIKR